jgi:hypothetical protein
MVKSRDQNAGQNHNLKMANKVCERVEQFIYLATTVTNQNSIQEQIKIILKECLLSFGAESFVFQIAIQKYKD